LSALEVTPLFGYEEDMGKVRDVGKGTMIRFATALLVCCLLSHVAAAADAKIGDTPLHLPQPPGYCEMDPVLASDAALLGRIRPAVAKTGNRLLIMSADCAELRDWRNGKRQDLDHMAQYQSMAALENEQLPDAPGKMAQNYCANMNALGDQQMPGTPRDVQKRAEQASKSVSVNEMKFLGVAAEDPLVCYAVTFQKFKVETREETTQVTIIATTILKEKVVSYHLFAPYVGRETITQLLATHRKNVSQLQRANRS
jgi:hypothetical protein